MRHLLCQSMKEDLGCLVSSKTFFRLAKELIKSCTLTLKGKDMLTSTMAQSSADCTTSNKRKSNECQVLVKRQTYY